MHFLVSAYVSATATFNGPEHSGGGAVTSTPATILSDGNMIFGVDDAGYRKMVLISNDGVNLITNGLMKIPDDPTEKQEWDETMPWMDTSKWIYKGSTGYYISAFSGVASSRCLFVV